MTLEHYRYNTDCDVWEELEPIDQNLSYDFDYQQVTHLPREHLVLPVSELLTRALVHFSNFHLAII